MKRVQFKVLSLIFAQFINQLIQLLLIYLWAFDQCSIRCNFSVCAFPWSAKPIHTIYLIFRCFTFICLELASSQTHEFDSRESLVLSQALASWDSIFWQCYPWWLISYAFVFDLSILFELLFLELTCYWQEHFWILGHLRIIWISPMLSWFYIHY